MSDTPHISDMDLHAYLDGELDPERREAVEASIMRDPEIAVRIALFRSDKDMLRQVYGPVADQPVPEHWLALASGGRRRQLVSWRLVGSIAAVLLLAIAATGTYLGIRSSHSESAVEEALDARSDVQRPQRIIAAGGADIGRYNDVLRATVKTNVRVPDLRRMGYRLTGIRLFSSAGGAAEILYKDQRGQVFTLYVRRSNGAPRFDQFERGGLRICVWQDEELSTVMAGNVSTAAMQRLASLAYTGLTL